MRWNNVIRSVCGTTLLLTVAGMPTAAAGNVRPGSVAIHGSGDTDWQALLVKAEFAQTHQVFTGSERMDFIPTLLFENGLIGVAVLRRRSFRLGRAVFVSCVRSTWSACERPDHAHSPLLATSRMFLVSSYKS